jgi:hypothetical protein
MIDTPSTRSPHRLPSDRCVRHSFGLTALLSFCIGSAACAQQSAAQAVWTSSSEAPPGALSHQLEAQRHDFFIELARAGDIDLVFFGTTEAEMWWWEARGQAVWARELEPLNAANFGSQGTRPASLLWRMRNGELDGYQAKLIVLQAGTAGAVENYPADYVAAYAALLDEIRLRQPEAKVLLFAPLPRGENLTARRRWAEANAAAFERYVDEEFVFYSDIGERFYRPDGSFNNQTWSNDISNRGTQSGAYEVWAEELQPWLNRFVR